MGADSASAGDERAQSRRRRPVMEAFADVLRNPGFDPDRLEDRGDGDQSRHLAPERQPAGRSRSASSRRRSRAATRRSAARPLTRRWRRSRATTCWRGTRSTSSRTASILGVVGDITVDEARALVTKYFGDWAKGPAWPTRGRRRGRRRSPASTRRSRPIRRSRSSPSATRVSCCAPAPTTSPVTVMNEVLAGGFTSRLFGKIRTELGLAYSVGGCVGSGWTRVAPFQMQMSTRADATVRAIEALIAEAKLLASTRPATDAELELAKDVDPQLVRLQHRLGARRCSASRSPSSTTGSRSTGWIAIAPRSSKVTAADVARVAAKYIHPDCFSIVDRRPERGARQGALDARHGAPGRPDDPASAQRGACRRRGFGGQARDGSVRFRRRRRRRQPTPRRRGRRSSPRPSRRWAAPRRSTG